MILHSLRVRGLATPFRDREATIDFTDAGPGILALVGGNGAGKTTLLEACCAALYRVFPSYGETVAEHVAPGVRDAQIELVFEQRGRVYRTLVQADPAFSAGRGKTEAYLFTLHEDDGTWTPVAGPLVREFDEAIAQLVPPKELFLASVFACQGGDGSFFDLSKGARKELFAAMLGLAHLQTLAEAARERAQAATARLEQVRRDLAAVEGRATRAAALDAQHATLTATLAEQTAAADAATATEAAARAALAGAREALAAAEAEARAAGEALQRATAARAEAETQVAGLRARIATLDAGLADAAAVDAAAAELPTLDAALAALDARERAAVEALRPLEVRLAEQQAERTRLIGEHHRVSTALEAAGQAAERAAALPALEAEAATKAEQLAAAEAALAAHDAQTPGLEAAADAEAATVGQRAVLEARERELAPRRTLLDHIPGVDSCDGCPLTADARKAAAALAEVRAELDALPVLDGKPAIDALKAHRAARPALDLARLTLQAWITDTAGKLTALRADAEKAAAVDALTAELEGILATGTRVRAGIDADTDAMAPLRAEIDAVTAERATVQARRAEIAPRAGRAASIAGARAQRAEAQTALDTAEAGRAALLAEALPTVPDLTPRRTAAEDAARTATMAETQAGAARAAVEATQRDLARVDGERTALGDPTAELATLRAREAALVTDVADWTLLERALGRDGCQALAIDAAGPAVTALANDLLAACYGPRFALALETTATTKDGKKIKEVFDVRILDSEAGREARRGSGGEMVILEEALRLALAIFNAQRSGHELRTLWRDETAGALSPENADRYVAMLRRAREIGGFHQVLFIAHQPAVWEQADVRLFVANGQVTADAGAQRAAA